jgi:hypothetical protein
MIPKSNLIPVCLTAISLLAPLSGLSQIFHPNAQLSARIPVSSQPLFSRVLDFNGDGKDEWVLTDYVDLPSYENKYGQPLTFIEFDFIRRLAVIPSIDLTEQPFVACILPPISPEDTQERILYLSGSQIQIVLYVNDPFLFYTDRYKIVRNELPHPVENPIFVGLDRYPANYSQLNNFIVVHTEGAQSKVSIYGLITSSLSAGLVSMAAEYLLPSTPKKVFMGHINKDIYSDLLFEMEDRWLIWMGTDGRYAPDDPTFVHQIPFPLHFQETTQVLFQKMKGYPLVLGIHNKINSNIATNIAAIAIAGDDELDWQQNPVEVHIPKKTSTDHVYLCAFENGSRPGFPIILMGRMPSYDVYALTPESLSSPLFIQDLTMEENPERANELYYLDKPIDSGDFNGDGVTDLLFTYYRINAGDDDLLTEHTMTSVNGIQQSTAINENE